MLKYLFAFLMTVVLTNAYADGGYHIATYKTPNFNPALPTRVLVAGAGDDLGLLFEEVAKAKAYRYKEINPQEQVVLIGFLEPQGSEWNLKRLGFELLKTTKNNFNGSDLINELANFKKILSLDIFSHSSAQFGIHLDTRTHHVNVRTRGLNDLKGNFVKGAYVYLHGCNTGFNLAPFLSKLWEIPVAGSLTSTNFQKLHTDGNFYLNDEGYAPNSDWAKTNLISHNEEVDCAQGACLRLKADNTPYTGFWGSYKGGGLPFYKFFCVKNSNEVCLKAMAQSMLSHSLIVNLKKSDEMAVYKKAVIDFLCPISSKSDLRGECAAKLEESLVTKDETYNPFSRPQLECNFQSCEAEIVCDKLPFTWIPKPGTCSLKNEPKNKASTLVREYKAYLQAFKYLSL